MTNIKTKSSALMITTLGVYLGLLLVGGATPQVFAHSATTRNFDISEELELHDDLDNNPDDVEGTSDSLKSYLNNLESFLNSSGENSGEHLDQAGDVSQTAFFVHLAGNIFDFRPDDLFTSLQRATQKASPSIAKFPASFAGAAVVRFERKPTLVTTDKTTSLKTVVRSANDQIFVVTRLPRAGLDSPLASYAK